MRILFTGGGTGGHIMPIIAVSRELRRLNPDESMVFHYAGPNDTAAILQLSQEEPKFKIHTIFAGKLRRYFSLLNITDLLIFIPLSFVQSFFLLLFLRPNLVFSKGGTGALPVTFCARLLFIPVFIHESDTIPGLSNRIASKWAKKVFVSFEKTAYFDLSKVEVVGTPIKKELLEGSEESAKEIFNLSGTRPVVMFWGGSQGAEPINEFITNALAEMLQNYEVIHVCGERNYKNRFAQIPAIINKDQEPFYHLYGSLNELQIKHAYKAVQLIISRSGSASIFEIAAAGKPSIMVPLPGSAGDHQSKNAYEYAKNGACFVIEQANLIPNFFLGKISQILNSPQLQQSMSKAALEFAKPLAAKAIAREILEFIENSQ